VVSCGILSSRLVQGRACWITRSRPAGETDRSGCSAIYERVHSPQGLPSGHLVVPLGQYWHESLADDVIPLPADLALVSNPSRAVTRPAVAQDGPRIAQIYLRAVRQAMPSLQLAHSDDEVRAWFSTEHQRRHEVWVAESRSSISAFLALSLDNGWVDHLYVDPKAQGCGRGSDLLALAKSRSSGQLRLKAFQRNLRARTFYEHRDFRAMEFGDGTTNEEGEPDVTYLWEREV